MMEVIEEGTGIQPKQLSGEQNVARQDSGVPDDLSGSPTTCYSNKQQNDDGDQDSTINSTFGNECNVTVIDGRGSENNTNIALKDDDMTTAVEGEKKDYAGDSKDSKEGSDSGVEGCATEATRNRNSGDYGSSCGGLDEASCDSSLVSCCSVYEDPCATLPDDIRLNTGGEGTSEGGSESSSVAGSVSARVSTKRTTVNSNPSKKKTTTATNGTTASVNLAESQKASRNSKPLPMNSSHAAMNSRSKARGSVPRSVLTKAQSTTADRGRSREKSSDGITTSPRTTGTAAFRSCSATTIASRSRTRPDTLPSALTTEITKDLAQRGRTSATSKSRGASMSRTRTPTTTTPSDERKSLGTTTTTTASSSGTTVKSIYNGRMDSKNSRIFDKMTFSLEGRSIPYATLPRTAKHKFPVTKDSEKTARATTRSRSGSRDASLNRLAAKKVTAKESSLAHKSLPPHPSSKPKSKPIERTKIYHEVSIQTGLTGKDIEKVLAGIATIVPNPESVESFPKDCQTDETWEDMQSLQAELRRVSTQAAESKAENEKLNAELAEITRKFEEEQADHKFAREELDRNAQRVLAMLGTPQSEQASDANDSFLELETQIQSSGQVVANQQLEIADLQSLCRMLNRDLEKSLAAQKSLLHQQQELEAESIEMQDFLLAEKASTAETLRESEADSKRMEESLKQAKADLERQTDECKHLVRISEQRRQENLSLNMKLKAVERKSRELLLTQGAAASGASVALSGLGSRLEGLVDQLVSSYNISEKDFEDVIYHNEAFSRSNSSADSSPVSSKHSLKDCTPSPKRGSFVYAVIGAIRNATSHQFIGKAADKKTSSESKLIRKDLSTESSSDMLDFETEPCLMMESVLEDVPLYDTYSHNMVSSSDSLRRTLSVPDSVDESELRRAKANEDSMSLTNLSQAIMHRRKVEDEEEENYESVSESETGPSDGPLPLTDYCPTTSLVEQVIEVDNLVTKLLKVLRIIQLDNDTCIQELRDERTELEAKLEAFLTGGEKADDSAKKIFRNAVTTGKKGPMENGEHPIHEMNNAKESPMDGKADATTRNEKESTEEDILVATRALSLS